MSADFSFLKEINLFQVGVAIVTIYILWKFIKSAWKGIPNTIEFINNIGKVSDFMDNTNEELKKVSKVEEGVAGLYTRVDTVSRALDAHLEDSREWKKGLRKVQDQIVQHHPTDKE